MTQFNDESNLMCSIPQSFADGKLKRCPVCKAAGAGWLVGNDRKLFTNYLKFKCKNCGCILSATEDDVTGFSNTTKTFAGKQKENRGKENNKVYITVEKIEYAFKTQENMTLEGSELTLEEIQAIAAKE